MCYKCLLPSKKGVECINKHKHKRNNSSPKMIVIKKSNGDIINQYKIVNTDAEYNEKRVFIFDLDRTLWDDNYQLYPDTMYILKKLRDLKIDMYVASLNTEGDKILNVHNLSQYFKGISSGRFIEPISKRGEWMSSKLYNIQYLITKYDLDKNNMVIFDDDERNIIDFAQQHIHAIYVDPRVGITKHNVSFALKYVKTKDIFKLPEIKHTEHDSDQIQHNTITKRNKKKKISTKLDDEIDVLILDDIIEEEEQKDE